MYAISVFGGISIDEITEKVNLLLLLLTNISNRGSETQLHGVKI